ncbi:MAG: hypothetical protein GC168_02780 [Candidatus Hydrogenedens sp.]|nr:hypothetical protein [Candidatus Hydrogenedens sp.]
MPHRKWNKYWALAWEQLLVTGSVCAAAFGVNAAFAGVAGLSYASGGTSLGDARAMAGSGAVLLSMLIAIIASVARQNAAGELSLDFDPRLRRMPVYTLPLVSLVFFVRTGCLFLFAAVGAAQWYWFGSDFDPAALYFLLIAYLVLQTIVWTRSGLTGIEYLVGGSVLAVALGTLYGLQLPDATFALLVLVYAAAFLVSLAGIALIRRDARWPLPRPGEIFDAITGLNASPRHPFRNGLAAQVWYEGRRAGWLLLFTSATFTVIGFVILRSGDYLNYDDRYPWNYSRYLWLYPWVPYIALLLAAPIAGAVALSTGAGPTFMRPLETRHLALAKLVALFRALAIALPLAAVVSALASALSDTALWDIMMDAWNHGEIDLAGLLAWRAGPMLLMAVAAWALMFARSLESLAIAILSAACFVIGLVLADLNFMNDEYLGNIAVASVPMAVIIVVTGARYRKALRSGVLPGRAFDIAAAICALSAILVLLYAGSVQFDANFLWVGLACGCLLVLPGASVSLHLQRQRHR